MKIDRNNIAAAAILTNAEFAFLQSCADKFGMSVSTYIELMTLLEIKKCDDGKYKNLKFSGLDWRR